MNDITELLKQGDPVTGEAPLDASDLRQMRRRVMTTLPEAPPAVWPRPVFVVATLAGAIAASVAVGRYLPRPDAGQAHAPVVTNAPERVTRQLQFETPGGTRIIWVFDPDFKL